MYMVQLGFPTEVSVWLQLQRLGISSLTVSCGQAMEDGTHVVPKDQGCQASLAESSTC